MSRPEPLTSDVLDGLPERCASCLFWELGRPRPDAREKPVFDELAGDPRVQKHAWCGSQTLDSGPPGRVIMQDDKVIAHALFAPSGEVAVRRPPIPPLSEDALVLAMIWVDPPHRQGGLARRLVQSAIKDALARGLPAVEAYGDRRFREADCVLPVTFLLHEGFTVHREHPRYPLLRLDVGRTIRWTENIEARWDDVRERLPRRAPAPLPRHHSTPTDLS